MFPLSETGRFSCVLPAQRQLARNIWRTRGSKTPRTPRLVTGGFINLSVSVQGPVAGILENLLEDPTKLWFLRLCSQGLWQLFPKVGMTIENNILEVLVEGFVSLVLQIGDIDKITT